MRNESYLKRMNIESNMAENEKTIELNLPLTTATGKIRVKRRNNEFGDPFSTTNNKLDKKDYFEWQISYFMWLDSIWSEMFKDSSKKRWNQKVKDVFGLSGSTDLVIDISNMSGYTKRADFVRDLKVILKKHDSIVVQKPHKDGREFVANELAYLFRIAKQDKMINKKDIEALLAFNTGKDAIDIEDSYKVESKDLHRTICEGFECYLQETPLFIKRIDDNSFVEIALKHKQRAVGFQSMVYFGYYLNGASSDDGSKLIGRTAKNGELVKIRITKEHLIWVAKAFIIASRDHSWDIKKILEIIAKE